MHNHANLLNHWLCYGSIFEQQKDQRDRQRDPATFAQWCESRSRWLAIQRIPAASLVWTSSLSFSEHVRFVRKARCCQFMGRVSIIELGFSQSWVVSGTRMSPYLGKWSSQAKIYEGRTPPNVIIWWIMGSMSLALYVCMAQHMVLGWGLHLRVCLDWRPQTQPDVSLGNIS